MKKLAILGASAALAAMPVVGVFAADGTLTQTDTVVVTVDSACSLATSSTGDYTATIANSGYNTSITGSTFTVTCNDTNGWYLSAIGAGEGTTVAHMDASTKAADDIATGTTLDGSVSAWAFKLEAGGAAVINGSYDGFSVIPTASAKVAYGSTTTAGTDTVKATYGVGISSTQAAGTYTGKVAYTLAHPNS